MVMLTRTEISLIAEKVAELIHIKNDELLTAKQCAEWLGVSVDTLHSRCSRGHIPYHKKHKTLYFSKNEVMRYYLKDDNSVS